MSLREYILNNSIQLEKIASDIVKAILRINKPQTKTLSNKSSNFSFKNKIDLLYDLEEISNDDYTQLVKFMEIRNQFIHNYYCKTFTNIKEENSELSNYLSKNFQNNNSQLEESLKKSYDNLFRSCLNKLSILRTEFLKGVGQDIKKSINHKVMEEFDQLLARAKSAMSNRNADQNLPLYEGRPIDLNIELFILYLKNEVANTKSELMEKFSNDPNLKSVFNRKQAIEDILSHSDNVED